MWWEIMYMDKQWETRSTRFWSFLTSRATACFAADLDTSSYSRQLLIPNPQKMVKAWNITSDSRLSSISVYLIRDEIRLKGTGELLHPPQIIDRRSHQMSRRRSCLSVEQHLNRYQMVNVELIPRTTTRILIYSYNI